MKFRLSLEPTRMRRKASTIRITVNCIVIFEHIMILLLPENCRRILGEAMLVKSFSVKEFSRRLRAVRELWCGLLPKIKEETGLTTELILKYYVEKVLHQAQCP
jgi:hypothetical protein